MKIVGQAVGLTLHEAAATVAPADAGGPCVRMLMLVVCVLGH